MADTAPAQLSKSVGHRERRRKLRKSAEDLCLVTVEMGPAGFGLMLDVSEGGLGVQIMNRVEPGTNVQIAFKVPELASRIEGSGVVTWCDGDGRLGIRFQQLKDSSDKQLQQWIDSLPEATVHEPIQLSTPSSAALVSEQVRAIKAQIAASKLDVDLVLQFLVERVVELTHSNGGAIALGEGADMVCRAASGLAPDIGVSIGNSSALTSECIRTAKIVRCHDTETDSRVDREICRELNLRSSLILPILFEAKVKGVLEVFSPLPRAFSDKHLALLQQLAEFTAQIVYGPMPAGAVQIESSAKANAKPEHTALSALLTATTTAAESPAPNPPEPKPVETTPPAKPLPHLVPPAPKSAKIPEAPSVAAKPVSSSGAAAKPAPLPEPAPSQAPVAAKATAPVKEQVVIKEPTKATKEAVIAKGSSAFDSHATTQSVAKDSFEGAEETEASSYRSVYITIAVLLVMVALGWFYFTQHQPTTPPTTVAAPTTQQPAQPLPTTTTPATTTAQPAGAAKPNQPGLVAADTIHTPNAAIVRADQSAPLVIASADRSRSRNEAPAAVAPSISVASNPNLGSISIPGAIAKPELQQAPGGVTGGNLLKRVEPAYPTFARQQRIQGDVVMSARIMKDGTLDRLKRIKGNPVFEPAAIAALSQWRYEPYKLNGQPQEVDTTITLQFKFKQ